MFLHPPIWQLNDLSHSTLGTEILTSLHIVYILISNEYIFFHDLIFICDTQEKYAHRKCMRLFERKSYAQTQNELFIKYALTWEIGIVS